MADFKNQTEFAAEMFKRALPVKGFVPQGESHLVLWLRGLHYYIVSLPESERQMPAKNGTRAYENTKQEYKKLSENWVKARLEGLIDENYIWDNRNAPIIEPRTKHHIDVMWNNYDTNTGNRFEFEIQKPYDFDEYVNGIQIRPQYSRHEFTNQMYEVIVVTEKLTTKAVIEGLCMKYGVNCLVVKGQASFTRVSEAAEKARKNNRPLLLLGIYDLDCAGWDMPTSFMKRVSQIYPHPHHKFVRVALTRELAEEYNLPSAFEPDDKGYPAAQKERFYEESKGRTCIELDALDNQVIRDLLEDKLKEYCRPQLDQIQERRFKKNHQRKIDKVLEDLDISDLEEKYNRIYESYHAFYKKAKKWGAWMDARAAYLAAKFGKIEDQIKDELEHQLEG